MGKHSMSWTGRLCIVKTTLVPKVIYEFNAIPIKTPMVFFTETEKSILKFVSNLKGFCIATAILKKKTKTGGITLPNLKTYYKATVIKTVGSWHIDRPVESNLGPRNKP